MEYLNIVRKFMKATFLYAVGFIYGTVFVLSLHNITYSSPKASDIELISEIIDASLTQCCSIRIATHPKILLQCVNSSLSMKFKNNLLDIAPYYAKKDGPRLLVAIVTRVTPQIFEYAAYSMFVQASYARYHGYLMFPVIPDNLEKKDYRQYRKVSNLIDRYFS
jgi:hypothetical protein